nr:endonuclease/exonuclease/phosphatase family protein [Marinibactrum halimedae]
MSVVRIATFNVSMEEENYPIEQELEKGSSVLQYHLSTGRNQQMRNIAEILQRTRPDIVLLNEFDFIEDRSKGVDAFQQNYLSIAQHESVSPINYPHIFLAPTNTGAPSPYDFDQDGVASGVGGDAWGFGKYPGQYGMVLLSRFPINKEEARTLQLFKWSDMPGALQPKHPETNQPWFSQEQWQALRLSSKSHWDVPVMVGEKRIHVLAQHPTPPVFDGPENRNGLRNHDELRLTADYLSEETSTYIYDDKGNRGGLSGDRFVILGDLNASIYSDATYPGAMERLLNHPKVNSDFIPTSRAGAAVVPELPYAKEFTAAWKSRADYVLPSKSGFNVIDGAVFWPEKNSPLYRLVESREASSDHRLVWLELEMVD